jgi:DNA primase
MAKISPVSAKYIIHSSIEIEGVVDRPDVIGAIFGQTEGLLGADLELRELQRSGRIGRIEVNVDTKSGKTQGMIVIPSSLDKAETSIVAAALEIIQRIGPCNAKLKVQRIEDVRVSKRIFVVERAKELLKTLMDTVMPDSQELADEVSYSVRVMEIQEYGKDRLPAGPSIDESDEIVIVEGRADVLNLLKHGIKNVIALNGTSVPPTIIELCQKKTVTAFVDGDRGGDLILKELTAVAEIDFVTKAPDGKEVEEITKKEIHKCIRGRIAIEQAKMDINKEATTLREFRPQDYREGQRQLQREERRQQQQPQYPQQAPPPRVEQREPPREMRKIAQNKLSPEERAKFRSMLEDLIGTRGAYILDANMAILGKVPFSELATTLKSLSSGVFAIVFDGVIDRNIVVVAERINVAYLVAMESKVKNAETRCTILTVNEI